jgi:hypothetical protein
MIRLLRYALNASVLLTLLGSPLQARSGFIVFQVPGANQTNPSYLSNSGDVVGTFSDASGYHGFIRSPDGTFTTIDVPGSTTTDANEVDKDGTIIGSYTAPKGTRGSYWNGFIRSADGTITTFAAPHATHNTNFTAFAKNGWIAGTGIPGIHTGQPRFGFLRSPSGHYIEFGNNLDVTSANSSNVVTGIADQSGIDHGFVRTPDGTITQFDPEGANYTVPSAINAAGTVAGVAELPSGAEESFIRASDGTISTFVVPNALFTDALSINKNGMVAGSFENYDASFHDFIRSSDGTITVIDVPGATGTYWASLNDKGQVAGQAKINGTLEGFIWKP